MRTNPMKEGLAKGEAQIGSWVNMVRNPAILQLMKSAGMDFARVDIEHSTPSMETIGNFALLSRALGFPITVRPPEGNREWITRLLDAGVWCLHIPQVDTPEIAEEVASASHYAPDGLRGMAGFGPGTDYETGPLGETQRFINDQMFQRSDVAIISGQSTIFQLDIAQNERHVEIIQIFILPVLFRFLFQVIQMIVELPVRF